MFPVISDLPGNPAITHGLFVLLGLSVGYWVFHREVKKANAWDDRFIYMIVGIAVGGALGERIGSVAGAVASSGVDSVADAWINGGRSILGGLAGAYIGAILGKRASGYPGRTGDYFAPAIALGLAVGRIGCFLTEAPGRPTGATWGITTPPASLDLLPGCPGCAAGVPMHPSMLYEIVFLLVAYIVIQRYKGRITAPGETLVLFLAAYALFRFGVEFTRANPPDIWGLTRSQVFIASLSPIFIFKLVQQARRGTYSQLWNAQHK